MDKANKKYTIISISISGGMGIMFCIWQPLFPDVPRWVLRSLFTLGLFLVFIPIIILILELLKNKHLPLGIESDPFLTEEDNVTKMRIGIKNISSNSITNIRVRIENVVQKESGEIPNECQGKIPFSIVHIGELHKCDPCLVDIAFYNISNDWREIKLGGKRGIRMLLLEPFVLYITFTPKNKNNKITLKMEIGHNEDHTPKAEILKIL